MAAVAVADDAILNVRDVSVRFGGIVALDGVSFEVGRGQICGIIGPNGAGKTTLFNCLSRLYTPSAGEIVFDGRPLLSVPSHGMASLGIGRTFQNVALFDTLTVAENVMMGRHCRTRSGFAANILRRPSVRREEAETAEKVAGLLSFLDLEEVADTPVEELSFGVRKRVELARALASDPKLLMLDEPAGGLNHAEVEGLLGIIETIRDRYRLTVLLVEHHLNMVMRVSDKVVAINFGRKIADGTPAEVQANPEVVRAYLGDDD